MTQPVTLGLIVGNRGFFPSHLCTTGRAEVMAALKEMGIRVVAVDEHATPHGAIESLASARICADLFRAHREFIDGILITLPNFGEERPIADTVRWAGLDVPVLVHAFADAGNRMDIEHRRDSFCGKMSACNNLKQYGIPYSLTTLHTTPVAHPSFRADIERFAATCRVTRALRHARLGAIGARPSAFNTVRYSEKLLEQAGISVETLDLSELLGWANRMADNEPAVQEKLSSIHGYTSTKTVPTLSLMKMAKLGVALDRFVAERELHATAIQCWTALEEFYGVVPCTLMSMMSNSLMPSACETDVAGVVGMYVLQAASTRPAALLDWNNNYEDDPEKAVVFHCSNLPRDFFTDQHMDYQAIIAGTVGKENTYGTIVGRVASGPFTYCRISTDDARGVMSGYVGEGRFTDDTLDTFGGYGVVEVPEFQHLLQFICREGFEHHVAATRAEVAAAVDDALTTYKGWDIYRHG